MSSDDPPLGEAWTYLFTGEENSGLEGTLGFAAGAERSNFNPCLSVFKPFPELERGAHPSSRSR